MTNNITLTKITRDSGAYVAGTTFETEQQTGGEHRPIVKTAGDGYISLPNSTAAAGESLAGGATWNGTSDSPIEYGGVRVIVYADQVSATNGLKIYCSNDGTNFVLDDQYTVPANTVKTFAVTVSPYVKVTYTNGATPANVKICTLFLKHMSVVSSHRIQDNLNDDDDGQLTVSVLKLRTAQNTYVSGASTNSGNFKVSLEEVDGVVVPTTRADDFYNDAFQRLRVSNTDQRLDVEFIYDKQPLLFDEIVAGNGTATHEANGRQVKLAVGGTADADEAGLYQHFYNPYTPGNSQFIAITGTANGANAAGVASVFVRSNVTGTPAETVIDQEDWIGAASGVNWQYSQIFLIDFQSLKIGRIRFALDRAGLAVPVAVVENDNTRATGYWQMANAPIFWKVYNTATATVTEFGYGDANNAVGFRYTTNAVNGSQFANAICATVKSEGGGNLLDIAGYKFAVGNGATTRTVAAALLPVLSIQLKTTFGAGPNRGLAFPQAVSWQSDNPIYYQVVLNPTLTNESFNSVDANSLCNFDVAATALSGGRVIAAGYASSGSTRAGATQISLTGKAPLSVNYAGTVGDILTLAAIRTTVSSSATGAALEWKEVR